MFDLNQEFLDVRDIIKRVEELRGDRDGHVLGAPDGSETPNAEGWAQDEPDDAEELDTLESILSELAGMGGDEDWEGDWYPITLHRESNFEDYAREFAEDIGAIKEDASGRITSSIGNGRPTRSGWTIPASRSEGSNTSIAREGRGLAPLSFRPVEFVKVNVALHLVEIKVEKLVD